MQKHAQEAMLPSRRRNRRRARWRAAAAVFGVLLLFFLLYCTIKKALTAVAEYRWNKVITHAFSSGDSGRIAALLARCGKEAPFLQNTPRFARWEAELLRLQEMEKLRRREFAKRLTDLQKKLKEPNGDLAWQEKLTSVAAYAANDEEFAQVRMLEAHCKTLEELRHLEAAQKGVRELQKIENALLELQDSVKNKAWQKYQMLYRQMAGELDNIVLKYTFAPEIGQRATQLKKTLEAVQNTALQTQKTIENEQKHFQKIFADISQNAITGEIKKFLKLYPASSHAPGLRSLLKDLSALQTSQSQVFEQVFRTMSENNLQAQAVYAKQIGKITAEEVEFGSFELILRTHDNRIVRFITLSKCYFINEKDGSRTISFSDINNQPVKGTFAADGSGSVAFAGNYYQGKMAYGKPEGMLTESVKQRTLLKIKQLMQNYKAEDFPLFLYFLEEQSHSSFYSLLPAEVKAKLQNAKLLAEKILKARPLQFIFTREIVNTLRLNPPIFAGILEFEGKTFTLKPAVSALAAEKTATLWSVNADGKTVFTAIGKVQKGQQFKPRQTLGNGKKFTVAAMPAGGADYAELLKVWEQFARKEQLKMPPLPDFLSDFIR